MLTVRKPSPALIRTFLAAQSQLPFTYPGVGATATTPPAGFVVDRTRVKLGAGGQTYERSRQALIGWKPFALGWLEATPAGTPLRVGEPVAVVAHVMGLWWLNAARIVYVVDDQSETVSRFGFAYGTLPGHAEMGEERFLVEWDRASDEVHYEILAFSRPQHLLARLGRWQVRRLQRRFGQDSAAAMQQYVQVSRS